MNQARHQNSKLTHHHKLLLLVVLIVLIVVAIGYEVMRPSKTASVTSEKTTTSNSLQSQSAAASSSSASTPAPVAGACATNTLSQNVIVSISKRHLWGCSGTAQDYDSAVVTGMENLPADLTPTGTYHIYGKQTDLHLKGSDSTGSWDDFVYYWIPFLSNQYGIYGFHDATWRAPGDFGNIDPYSSNASHGCVELPLATAKWLYGWASVGTTVTIES